ncbi:uncharacterized protein LOC116616203 [Nematostella vectensis]|uniref:uncharacterized protein LOC116616203 n=1 Tax=Nematostella vectensis TaxID=45351 RepID=UPI0020773F36|nr:uncharacterized protein LOC116616203 [Nematostella vectensis]
MQDAGPLPEIDPLKQIGGVVVGTGFGLPVNEWREYWVQWEKRGKVQKRTRLDLCELSAEFLRKFLYNSYRNWPLPMLKENLSRNAKPGFNMMMGYPAGDLKTLGSLYQQLDVRHEGACFLQL